MVRISETAQKGMRIFFVCVLSFAVVSAAAAQQEPTGQTSDQKPLSDDAEYEYLSKEELLGEDYGTPPDLTQVKAQINSHLEAIADLCEHKSVAEQINQLIKSLSALRAIIPPNLDRRHLTIKDAVFLRRVYHTIAEEGILTYGIVGIRPEDKLTLKSFEEDPVDLAGNFLHHYLVRYNLDEGDGFYRQWEEDLYKGLTCVKPPPPKVKL